jgi:hypothetical protein
MLIDGVDKIMIMDDEIRLIECAFIHAFYPIMKNQIIPNNSKIVQKYSK